MAVSSPVAVAASPRVVARESTPSPAEPVEEPRRASREEFPTHDGCYSARLSRPFLRVLRKHPNFPQQFLDALSSMESLDLDERLPVASVHRTLEAVVQVTGDQQLGLKAARERTVGDSGAMDYAIASASDVRHALEAVCRYIRLVNDALDLHLDVGGPSVVLWFENHVPLPRPAMDFQIGGIFRALTAIWSAIPSSEVTVSFAHPAPDDASEYLLTFENVNVRFGESYFGFSFPAKHLDTPLKSADSLLHEVLRRHAEKTIAELPPVQHLSARVRSVIADNLSGGNPGIINVARRLRLSTRTLARKLEQEGTTFSALLDDIRRRLALRHVAARDLELSEIAFLLGFSQTTAFHRAFKRWTGETPLSYRKARRGQPLVK
jgi:AraC-like DNA-binding protein